VGSAVAWGLRLLLSYRPGIIAYNGSVDTEDRGGHR
jgi:hypothetical protein